MDSLVERAAPTPPAAPDAVRPPIPVVAQLKRAAIPIVVCAAIGAGGAYMYARTLQKSYTANAQVAVEGDQMAIPELQGALRPDSAPDPMPMVHTEVQALSARQLVEQVTAQLHLDHDPEFNAALRPPTFLGGMRDRLKNLLPGSSTDAKAPNGAQAAQDGLIGAVQHNLVISQDNRSLVIGIGFSAHDPALAANFINTLITDYIDARAQRRTSADLGANTVVSRRIDQVRADIERIEKQMRDLRDKSGLVGLRAGSVGQQQVEDLATAASRATLDRSQIEANYNRAQALAAGGSSDALASVLGSETISRLREQEAQAAGKVADLEQRYGPEYPALKSAQADLNATRRQIGGETHRIVASLATQLKVARAHEADVLGELAKTRQSGVAAQNTQAQLDQLAQDVATRRDLYRTLLEREQQTATTPVGDRTPDVRVLSQASVPGLPSAPNTKMAAAYGGLGGGLLACMAALAFTRRSTGTADAAAFARAAGLHVVATLRGRSTGRGLADKLLAGGTGPEADAMRLARTRTGQLSRTPPRVVGFVGAQPGPAGTSAACAYARTAARDGQHVLLIDQDGETGAMPRMLGEQGGRLAEVLTGEASWRDAVAQDRVPGLETLVGTARPGPDTQRSAVGLENLLAEARGEYDLIVMGAPLASHADATRVARSSDVTVVVLDEALLREQAASEACARLRSQSRSPLAAIVISRG